MDLDLHALYEQTSRLWNSLDEDVQDSVWCELGGPATDELEQAAQAVADRLGMNVDQAAMLIFATLPQRLDDQAQGPR